MLVGTQIRSLVFLAIFFALLVAFRAQDFFWIDGDSPWHVIAGQYIRESSSIPEFNPWDISSAPSRWINISWAYDVALSICYSVVGIKGLVAWVLIAATLLLFGLFLYLRSRNVSGEIAGVATIAAFAGLAGSFTARPQLFGEIFFLLYLAIGNSRLPRTPKFLCQFFLACIWANVHGSFLLLIIIATARLCSFGKERLFKQESVLEIIPLLGVFLNPYGYGIIAGAFASVQSNFGPISEWLPPSLGVQIIIALITCAGWLKTRNIRSLYFERTMLVILAYLAILNSRHLPFFLIMASLILSTWLRDVFWLKNGAKRIYHAMISIGGVCILALYHMIAPSLGLPGLFSSDVLVANSQVVPTDEIKYLRSHYAPQAIFAFYNYGGLVLFLTDGQFHPFVDGRAATAFSEKRLTQYMMIQDHPALLSEMEIGLALVPIGELANRFEALSNWSKSYCGTVACIFHRKTG